MDADIIVIGASPAGLMAARNACEKGSSVLLLEKKEEIGNPPHPANSFFKGMLDKCGEVADPSYVVHYLKGMQIISPSGRIVEVETPGYAIDKTKFLSLIHISEPTRLGMISYAVFC